MLWPVCFRFQQSAYHVTVNRIRAAVYFLRLPSMDPARVKVIFSKAGQSTSVEASGVVLQDQGGNLTAITFDQPCQLTEGTYTVSISVDGGCSVRIIIISAAILHSTKTVRFQWTHCQC